MIPMLIIVIIKLDPPYERNGSVTPVIGTKPTTTDKFKIVWKASWNVIPNDKYLPNRLLQFNDILIHLLNIVINNIETIIIPSIPNSSLIIENMKSVCGSGK